MNTPILIIDDDRPMKRKLRLLLASHAFDGKEADDGLALLDGGLSVDVISDGLSYGSDHWRKFSQGHDLSCERPEGEGDGVE